MRYYLFFSILFITSNLIIAQNLDPDFGDDGILLLDNYDDPGFEVYPILDTEGKLFIAGTPNQTFMNSRVFVTKVSSDGTVDTNFGQDGYAEYDLGNGFTGITDFIQLSNGNLLVAGTSFQSGWLVMFDAEGILISDFGDNGFFDTQISADNNRLHIAEVNDKILCVHKGPIGGVAYLATSVYNMDGTYDISYGLNGTIVYNDFQFSSIEHVSWDFDANNGLQGAYLAVYRLNGEEGSFVTYIDANGTLNDTFAEEGVYRLTGGDFIYDIALDFNKDLLISARSGSSYLIQKLDSNGDFVSDFGTDGMLQGTWSLPLNSVEKIIPLADGGFLQSGNMDEIAEGKSVFQKHNVNGSVDAEIGEVVYDLQAISSRDMLYSDNGDIYIFGFTIGEMLNVDQLFVIKYTSDITDVSEVSQSTIMLYPNPSAIPNWNLEGDPIDINKVSISNMEGKLVADLSFDLDHIYTNSDLDAGMYIISIQTSAGEIINTKMVLLD